MLGPASHCLCLPPRSVSLTFLHPLSIPWVRLDAALAMEQHQAMLLPDMLGEATEQLAVVVREDQLAEALRRCQETRTGEDVPVAQLLWRLDSGRCGQVARSR